MTVLNFAHPFTPEQTRAIESLAGRPIERVLHLPAQLDHSTPFTDQVRALVERAGLSPDEWQTLPLLVNLPSLSAATGLVLAELHGRCGYFPAIVRMRPVAGSVTPRFEVAELLDLQFVREEARCTRSIPVETLMGPRDVVE